MRLDTKSQKSLNESYLQMQEQLNPGNILSYLGRLPSYGNYLASPNKGPLGTLADLIKKSSMQAMIGPEAAMISRIANIYTSQQRRANMEQDWYKKQYGNLPQIY